MHSALNHRTVCPLVANPRPECFCSTLTSQTIIQVVHYCCDRFLECAVFLRQQVADNPAGPASAPVPVADKGAER